jgi:DNA-binding FrmR family transcriptional regulator
MGKMIKIIVKSINGQFNTITVDSNDKCGEIANQVKSVLGSMRLIYAGKEITDDKTKDKKIEDVGIEEGATIFIVYRLLGAARSM